MFGQCHRPVGPHRWSRRQMSCWKCHKTTMFTWSPCWHTPELAWALCVCACACVLLLLLEWMNECPPLRALFRFSTMRMILIYVLLKPWNRLLLKHRGLYLHPVSSAKRTLSSSWSCWRTRPCVYVGGGKKYPFLLLLMVNIIRQLTVKRGDMAG